METTISNTNMRTVLRKIHENYVLGVDSISYSKKRNEFFAKRSFFYRHGCDSSIVANGLEKRLNDALAASGYKEKVVITEHREEWKPWPKDSFWIVYFTLQ